MAPEPAPLTATSTLTQADDSIRHAWAESASSASTRRVRVVGPPSFSLRTVFTGIAVLVEYKDLLYTLSIFRLNVRYKQSMLGWVWAALQPLALMGIYTFVFSHVAKVNTNGTAYPPFVFCGLLPWIFFSSAVTSAVHGMVAYPTLLTKMYFPREIIPLSYLAAGVVDFAIASVVLVSMLFVLQGASNLELALRGAHSGGAWGVCCRDRSSFRGSPSSLSRRWTRVAIRITDMDVRQLRSSTPFRLSHNGCAPCTCSIR